MAYSQKRVVIRTPGEKSILQPECSNPTQRATHSNIPSFYLPLPNNPPSKRTVPFSALRAFVHPELRYPLSGAKLLDVRMRPPVPTPNDRLSREIPVCAEDITVVGSVHLSCSMLPYKIVVKAAGKPAAASVVVDDIIQTIYTQVNVQITDVELRDMRSRSSRIDMKSLEDARRRRLVMSPPSDGEMQVGYRIVDLLGRATLFDGLSDARVNDAGEFEMKVHFRV